MTVEQGRLAREFLVGVARVSIQRVALRTTPPLSPNLGAATTWITHEDPKTVNALVAVRAGEGIWLAAMLPNDGLVTGHTADRRALVDELVSRAKDGTKLIRIGRIRDGSDQLSISAESITLQNSLDGLEASSLIFNFMAMKVESCLRITLASLELFQSVTGIVPVNVGDESSVYGGWRLP